MLPGLEVFPRLVTAFVPVAVFRPSVVDILLVTAFLVTRLLVCVTAPGQGVHHPEVSGRRILGEGYYDPKPPAETTKDLRWRVRCDDPACFSCGSLLLASLRWCGRCVPAARRLRLQRYWAIPRKSLSDNLFGSTESHVIIGLRGPGYASGSGLAPFLRNRDKRHLRGRRLLAGAVSDGVLALERGRAAASLRHPYLPDGSGDAAHGRSTTSGSSP